LRNLRGFQICLRERAMTMNEDGSEKKILNLDQLKARLYSIQDEGAEDSGLTKFLEKWKKVIRIAAVVLIALAVYFGLRTLKDTIHYTDTLQSVIKEDIGGADASYDQFKGSIIKMTGDGVSALDTDGEIIWSHGYSMSNPRMIKGDEYGAVIDLMQDSAAIFGKDGVTGTIKTSMPILGYAISDHGVLALELDSTDSDYIQFYDSTGRELDIRIKTMLSGDGFPLDISLSPSGTGLITSMVYMDQGSTQNQIICYNFDVGKNDSNRIVGTFAYGDTMFPQVEYMSRTRAVAFGDNQLNFYNMRNESKPVLLKSIGFTHEISSVIPGKEHVGVVAGTDEGDRMIYVYDDNGREVFSRELDFDYAKAEFSGSYLVLYNSSECRILSLSGRERFSGTIDGGISKIIMTGDSSCLLFSGSALKRVRFR